MSRRRKNAGKGFGKMFHGAFGSKEDAKKKERQVGGWIQPRTIKGQRRFVVMSERKNPIRRKKKGQKLRDLGERDARAGKPIEAYYELPGLRHKESDRASYEIGYRAAKDEMRRSGKNPMDLVVMGANPEHKEIVVQPGQTITLRVNPSDAAQIREEFTGAEPGRIVIFDEPHMPKADYSKLGDLMGITFKPVNGGQVQGIGYYEGSESKPLKEAAKSLPRLTEAPILVSDESRRQLYFVHGNQDMARMLEFIKANRRDSDIWELGEARTIVYRERKAVEDFRLVNWEHEFGEENGVKPTLLYDAAKERLLLEGGDYEVRPEGIVN